MTTYTWQYFKKINYFDILYPTGLEPVTYNLEGYCSSGWAKGTINWTYCSIGLAGLEPTTFPLWAECSNQLNYRPKIFINIPDGIRTRVVPVKGEHPDRTRWQGQKREWWDSNPRLQAWQACTLTNWVTSPWINIINPIFFLICKVINKF